MQCNNWTIVIAMTDYCTFCRADSTRLNKCRLVSYGRFGMAFQPPTCTSTHQHLIYGCWDEAVSSTITRTILVACPGNPCLNRHLLSYLVQLFLQGTSNHESRARRASEAQRRDQHSLTFIDYWNINEHHDWKDKVSWSFHWIPYDCTCTCSTLI